MPRQDEEEWRLALKEGDTVALGVWSWQENKHIWSKKTVTKADKLYIYVGTIKLFRRYGYEVGSKPGYRQNATCFEKPTDSRLHAKEFATALDKLRGLVSYYGKDDRFTLDQLRQAIAMLEGDEDKICGKMIKNPAPDLDGTAYCRLPKGHDGSCPWPFR